MPGAVGTGVGAGPCLLHLSNFGARFCALFGFVVFSSVFFRASSCAGFRVKVAWVQGRPG